LLLHPTEVESHLCGVNLGISIRNKDMRDSDLVSKHAAECFEDIKPNIRLHPEISEEMLISIIEKHMLRTCLNVHGNVHDED
jgi:hypothetical protein